MSTFEAFAAPVMGVIVVLLLFILITLCAIKDLLRSRLRRRRAYRQDMAAHSFLRDPRETP